jgi:hypothetical protein
LITIAEITMPEKRAEMIEKAGGRTTVPQIFIKGQHIGGSDDLHALDHKGQLGPLLQGCGRLARIDQDATTGCDDLPALGAMSWNREFRHPPPGVILRGVVLSISRGLASSTFGG